MFNDSLGIRQICPEKHHSFFYGAFAKLFRVDNPSSETPVKPLNFPVGPQQVECPKVDSSNVHRRHAPRRICGTLFHMLRLFVAFHGPAPQCLSKLLINKKPTSPVFTRHSICKL